MLQTCDRLIGADLTLFFYVFFTVLLETKQNLHEKVRISVVGFSVFFLFCSVFFMVFCVIL